MNHAADVTPPFCPNPDCHHHRVAGPWPWRHHGHYRRKAAPHRIPRFQCRDCGRTFSTQTFSTTYWLRRPDLQPRIFGLIVSCTGLRQAARFLRCHHSTVQRQAERLGRHCLLFQHAHRPDEPPGEPLVLDGFLSFERGQYWPFELNLVVGHDSRFVYGFTDSELRRSGRMTASQKRRRAQLEALHGRPRTDATEKAVEQLLRVVCPRPGPVVVLSDEHRAYPRALRRLEGWTIDHRTVSSRRNRTGLNPLRAIDSADLMIRHSSANQKRESLAFSKTRQAAIERLAVLQVWLNFMKRRRVAEATSPSAAETLGLTRGLLSVEDVLAERLFPNRVVLPAPLERYYRRRVRTRAQPRMRTHELKYAA